MIVFFVLISLNKLAIVRSEWSLRIQERFDPKFDRNWKDYESGFGKWNGNFWFGLRNIHQLANTERNAFIQYIIKFEMRKSNEETVYWSEYEQFYIDGPEKNYTLHIAQYNQSSTAGDGMLSTDPAHTLNGMQFSTFDIDNDKWPSGSCSRNTRNRAGWWFNWCSKVNPNSEDWNSIIWENLSDLEWFRIVIFPKGQRESREEIVIQQRIQFFDRNWIDYKTGFGSSYSFQNYWAGLDEIHKSTIKEAPKIRFEMKEKLEDNVTIWSEYNFFKIDGLDKNYMLHIGEYNQSSTAGDTMLIGDKRGGLNLHESMFSTKDRDNDNYRGGSCSQPKLGGWWFNWCSRSNPNSGKFPTWDIIKNGNWVRFHRFEWFRIVLKYK